MIWEFHPAAAAEFEHASDYYDDIRSDLGESFDSEIKAAIARVLESPLTYPRHVAKTRRCLVQRFPYSIIYKLREDMVFIIAVAHQRRRPGYWRHRK